MPRAIVIGAGPAGSLSALLLGRAGFEVELLEQSRFPRDKVCGECLSALGLDVLGRAGLIERLRDLSPVTLTRTLVHPADGPTLDLPLPRPMWGLSRCQLDRALLATAADDGVVVRQPARCEAIESGPRVRWRDLATNAVRTSAADWVVVADGKSALMPHVPPPTGDLGIKTHFAGVDGPRDAIELFAGPGCYGGLAAVEADGDTERWNAAFSVPAWAVRAARGDIGKVFAKIVAFSPPLSRRLRGAWQTSRWLAAPLPRAAVSVDWPAGVVPVGNAAAALEPIGGEGMGLALRSAELAAECIQARDNVVGLAAGYQRLWALRRATCRLSARAVSTPMLADGLSQLLLSNPMLGRSAMRLAGKAAGIGVLSSPR